MTFLVFSTGFALALYRVVRSGVGRGFAAMRPVPHTRSKRTGQPTSSTTRSSTRMHAVAAQGFPPLVVPHGAGHLLRSDAPLSPVSGEEQDLHQDLIVFVES